MSTVSPGTENELTDTDYLLSSPANAAHLARSIEQYRLGDVYGESQEQIQSQSQKRDLVDEG